MNLTDQARFFIVYPLDLEDLGLRELKEKFLHHFSPDFFTLINIIPGGIEIECQFHIGLNLNKILRTPTRILLRIGEFKCRDAPKLYQKISKFNWAPWLIGQTPEIESASINSRLFDSRKIERAIQDGVLQYYRHKPVKKKYLDQLQIANLSSLPKIYFRSVDDICTLSLDTTGERLHKRGDKTLTGLAPIRENLATLLIVEMQKHFKNNDNILIDPMCGSGTFLLEAYRYQSVTTEREFSFQYIPLILDSKSAIQLIAPISKDVFKELCGFEIDANVVELARINCKETEIKINQADLFDIKTDYKIQNELKTIVIINPPYGIRVGEKSEINLSYYLKIIEEIQFKYRPELLGIIIPNDYKLKSNTLFKIKNVRPFKNGGIEVVFYVLEFK